MKNEFSQEDIDFFVQKINNLKPRKTKNPNNEYDPIVDKAKIHFCNKNMITVEYGYYHAAITPMDKKECDEWHMSYDYNFYVHVNHQGTINRSGNQYIGDIDSIGFYKTKEQCWRGLQARWHIIIN